MTKPASALSFSLLMLVGLGACSEETPAPARRRSSSGQHVVREVVIVPRTPHLPTYPCSSQCHDRREPDPTRRELTAFHTQKRLDHGPVMRWCDSCHTIDRIDELHLADGTAVSFDESYRLCGQCHGDRLEDFHNGTHGITGGRWDRSIERRNCTACHDPHAPGPIHLQALPSPSRDRKEST